MRRRPLLLYDAGCPLCTFQSRLLSWLDWFGTVRLVPFDHPAAAPFVAGIDPHELSAAIHLVGVDGRVRKGVRALRLAGLRMPALAPLAAALWIAGVVDVAEWCYDFVSGRRQTLSRIFGCESACRIMPTHRRPGDVL